MKIKTLLLLSIITIILSGCATDRKYELTLSANEYLQLSATAQEPKRSEYLLNAAQKYLEMHQTKTTDHILQSVNIESLSPELKDYWQLLQGRAALLEGNASSAINWLQPLQNSKYLNPAQLQMLYRSLAQANASIGDVANSLTDRQKLLVASDEEQQNTIIENTWIYLQSLDVSQLETISNSHNQIINGWYQLIIIAHQTNYTDQQLLSALQRWRRQFPKHPANKLLASNLSTDQLVYQKPRKISLLLPLSGAYANAANAIRNGFYAAYYSAKKSKAQNLPSISISNTMTNPIDKIYANAVNNGSDFIVGPLTKTKLQSLVNNNSITVPTLALNSLPDVKSPLLIQFSLSPMDEALQVANFAWSQHHQRALIITTNSPRGNDVLHALQTDWQNLGGDVVATWSVSSGPNLSTALQKILLIDQSRTRHWRIQAVTGTKLRYHQRRRQDIDVILLATTPVIARQIQPLMRYYLAGNIPIYATSQIYSGSKNPRADSDLNGIFFCDSSWILNPSANNDPRLAAIEKQIQSVWPDSFNTYRRFYGMGIDAFDLSSRLNRLLLLPRIGWTAASGNLFLNPGKHIFRQLVWARFEKGKAVLLNN